MTKVFSTFGRFFILFIFLFLSITHRAHAIVSGRKPKILKKFKVYGSAEATGNTMMSASPPGNVNDILLPQNSASIRGIPYDARVVAAYVWWTGSIDGQPDNQVKFTLPNGQTLNLTSDINPCWTVQTHGGFFYCRKEITNSLKKFVGNQLNGVYTLSDLKAKPGNCRLRPDICQARYAAWSMVIVWESPSYPIRRDIVLYDAFLHMDELPTSIGITNFTLTGFKVGNPPQGRFTYFGLEGDRFLGSPPEPPNYADFISFRATSATRGTRLQSSTPYNPPGNIWNSTISLGVDLDSFEIGRRGLNLIKPGDNSAFIVCGTGDGIVPGGNGESVFLGYILLTIDTLTPNFRNRYTYKQVDKLNASVGDTLTYTLLVTNTGSLAAKNTIVKDVIPPYTVYVPNSTRVDGKLVSDVGGTSPLVRGLNLGTLDFRGDNDRLITFQVKITGTPPNRKIENFFTVRSDEVGPTKSNTVVTTLRAPQIGKLTKTVKNQTNPNGPTRPGDLLVYTIEASNYGGASANALQFVDDLPKYVKLISVFPPAGTQNYSSTTGGKNGTGRIDIRNISVPANGAVRLFFTVRIFTEAEFLAAGIKPEQIHGLAIANQGELRAPMLPKPIKTDDPTTPAKDDPTVVRLSYRADFTGSTKSVRDDNGGIVEPGDRLTYTITLQNRGTRDTYARWEDPLPPAVTNFRMVSSPPGSQVKFTPPPAGANKTGLLVVSNIQLRAGQSAKIVFQVNIANNAPNGQKITNIGTIIDERDSAGKLTISSPTITVVSGPILDASTKTVTDLSGRPIVTVNPGQRIRYTITVRNTGNKPALNLVIRDKIPPQLDQVSPQGGRVVGGEIIWDKTTLPALASLGAKKSIQLTFTARVKPNTPNGTVISNQARISTPNLPYPVSTDDPNTPQKGDPTVIRVVSQPKLAISKIVQDLNGPPYRPGDQVQYTITVRNVGTAPAKNVVITDKIDPNLFNVRVTNGRLAVGSIVWDKNTFPALAQIPPGGVVPLAFTAQIKSPLPNGTVISNQAFGKADGLPTTPSDNPLTPAPNDPTKFTVTSRAEPKLTKSVRDLNGGVTVPGDTVLYTIVLTNAGTAPLQNAVVRDPIPKYLTQVRPSNGKVVGNQIVWDATTLPALRNVAPGQSVTLTFTAQIAANTPDRTVIANQAFLSDKNIKNFPSDDPKTPAPRDPTKITVLSRADLTASTKTVTDVNGGDLLPGEAIIYTITIENRGNIPARNVVITDRVDPNLTNVIPSNRGVYANGVITWRIPQIPANSSVTLTFTATVKTPLPDKTVISNQAVIQAQNAPRTLTDDPTTPAPDDPTKITVTSGPSLSQTTKEVFDLNGGNPVPGDRIRYVITVKNTGTDTAYNVRVRDPYPAQKLTNISVGQGGTVAGNQIVWNIPSIPAGREVKLTFEATINSNLANGEVIANQAFVTSKKITKPEPSDDPRTTKPDDPTEITVVAGSSFAESTKTYRDLNGGKPLPGDTILYTIVVKNTGTGAAKNVIVRDKIPTNLLVNVKPVRGQFNGSEIIWSPQTEPKLANIPKGGSVTLTFTAQIAPGTLDGTKIPNQAFIKADDSKTPVPTDDPTTPALDDPTVITVGGKPEIKFTKTVRDLNGGNARPKDTLEYTLTITNTGNTVIQNLNIADPLPKTLGNINFPSPPRGIYLANRHTIFWNIASLAPGRSVTLKFTAVIDAAVPDGTKISNQAQIVFKGQNRPQPSDDPTTPAPDDPTVITVISPLRISVTKTVRDLNAPPYRPGDTILYTIKITNRGTTPLADLTVTDRIDPNLTAVSPGQNGRFVAGTVVWTAQTTPALKNIPPNRTVTLEIRAQIRPNTLDKTVVKNQAVVRAPRLAGDILSDDPNTPQKPDPTVFTVTSTAAVVTATKEVTDLNGGTFEPGDRISYKIVVKNTTNRTVTGVEVRDPLPTTWLENITLSNGGQLIGNTAVWRAPRTSDLAKLSPGQSVTLYITARIKANTPHGTKISNQAEIKLPQTNRTEKSDDPNTPAPNDPTVFTVVKGPSLRVTKEVTDLNGGAVAPGDQLRYTIKITNRGTTPVTDVNVADNINRYLTSVSPGQNGNFASGIITWTPQTTPQLKKIDPGTTVTLTFEATVDPKTPNGTKIPNQALVKTKEIPQPLKSDDPTTPIPDDPTIVTVYTGPFLTVKKTALDLNGGTPQPGDIIEYTIVVVNKGTKKSTNTRLVDFTPQYTEFISNTVRLNGRVIPDNGTNPLNAGIPINSAKAGTPGGEVLPDDGVPPDEEWAVVKFRVRILPNAPKGAKIRNYAVVSADGLKPQRSNTVDLIVGGGPDLSDTVKKVRIAEDFKTPNRADIGDILEYTVTIKNSGSEPAKNLIFEDEIPQNSQYVPGTITANGQPKTDARDGDEALFDQNFGNNGKIIVKWPELKPGETLTITFRVKITGKPSVKNQGAVVADGLKPEPTDSDGDDTNGDQPTVTPVESDALLSATKEVTDVDGGKTYPGDTLEYTITLENKGQKALQNITLEDKLPPEVEFIDGTLQPNNLNYTYDRNNKILTVRNIDLQPGEKLTITFRVKISTKTQPGTFIYNKAVAKIPSADPQETNEVSILVEKGEEVTLSGLVFQDFGKDDTSYNPGDGDQLLPGFKVKIFPKDNPDRLLAETDVQDDGSYKIEGLRTSKPYIVKVFSENDVQYLQRELYFENPGERKVNLIVEPTGRIYSAQNKNTLIPGTRLFLLLEPKNLASAKTCRTDTDCGDVKKYLCTQSLRQNRKVCLELVPPEKLLENQQGQESNRWGMYRFDPPADDEAVYRIEVRPQSYQYSYPSSQFPPLATVVQFRDFAEGKITQADLPEKDDENKYYVRFRVTRKGKVIQNNHIPLDEMKNLLILKKRASKNTAYTGDIITYTLTLENKSTFSFRYDHLRKLGGIYITDVLPKHFQFFPKSPRAFTEGLSQQVVLENKKFIIPRIAPPAKNGKANGPAVMRILRFGPFELPAKSRLILRYQVSVKPTAKPGYYVNIAYAHNEAGGRYTRDARALVRIVYHPILDQGTLIGKVFCDQNRNSWQDLGEIGIQGVRLYLDNGYFAETDRYGRYHFQAIDPGNHLIKIDTQTLPPGSKALGQISKVFYVSRGLLRKINFPVKCDFKTVIPQSVFVKRKIPKKKPKPKVKTLKVEGSVYGPKLKIDGKPRPLPVVDLAVAGENQLPDFETKSGPDFSLQDGRLSEKIGFFIRISPGFSPKSWRLDIYKTAGGTTMKLLLHSIKGRGAPPKKITWNGRSKLGKFLLQKKTIYMARFTVETEDGIISQSRWRLFGIEYTKSSPKTIKTLRYPADWMGKRGIRPNARLKKKLKKLAKELKKLLRKKRKLLIKIEVHHDTSLSRTKALFLTIRRAAALKRYLLKELYPHHPIVKVKGYGSSRPILPNISRRNRRKNRRILIRVMEMPQKTSKKIPPLTFTPAVRIEGESLPITEKGEFSLTVRSDQYQKIPKLQIYTPFGAYVEVPLKELALAYQKKGKKKRRLGRSKKLAPKKRASLKKYPDISPELVILEKREQLLFKYIEKSEALDQLTAPPQFELFLTAPALSQSSGPPTTREKSPAPPLKGPKKSDKTSKRPAERKGPANSEKKGAKGDGKGAKGDGKGTKGDEKPAPLGIPLPKEKPEDREIRLPGEGGKRPAEKSPSKGIPVPLPEDEEFILPEALEKKSSSNQKERKNLNKNKKFKLHKISIQEAKNVEAAQLRVTLPPTGSVIRTPYLYIWGTTLPTNRVSIDGRKIPVGRDGTFRYRAPLRHGQKEIVIVSVDRFGNRAQIRWPVKVNLNRLFLLGFADLALSQREARQLQGFNDHSSFRAGPMIFHGRAVLYAKGSIQGKHLLRALFKKIKFTFHFDSAKKREMEEFYRKLIDPEKFYPIYGDGSRLVQDVTARDKLYILVEADASRLLVGNFQTKLRGIELLRYDRTFYGLDIDFQKRFAKKFKTRARFFISDGNQEQRKAHVEFQATGGSLYYLPHNSIVEGSEQVRVVVRDRISGNILKEIPLQRYADYDIQYFEGRLYLKYPLPSVVDSYLMAKYNPFSTLEGHPVYLEVDYEYENVGQTRGGLSFGVRASQTFWDVVKVGFSYARDERGGSVEPYSIWGFDVRIRPLKGLEADFEFAKSYSIDSESYFSSDGGLYFGPAEFYEKTGIFPKNGSLAGINFRRKFPLTIRGGGSGGESPYKTPEGYAFLGRVSLDLGQLFKWKRVGLYLKSYFAHRDRGFYASGQYPEQGMTKGGVLVRLSLFKKHQLQLRYDGMTGATPSYQSLFYSLENNLSYHQINIQYSYHFLPNWNAVIEYSYATVQDTALSLLGGSNLDLGGNFISLGVNWKTTKFLTLSLRQHVGFGTPTNIANISAMDYFATSLGLNLRVFKETYLSATGILYWSGKVGAQLGLKTKIDENSEAYITELINFSPNGSGLAHTLVVGAKRQITKNTVAYGEYQLAGQGISAMESRAVVGLQHVFHLFKGFFLGTGFEYSRVYSGRTLALTREFDRGEFLYPERLVGRLTVQYLGLKNLKASGRYEIRVDWNVDEMVDIKQFSRIQFVTVNNLLWQLHPDISLLFRLNYATTLNDTFKTRFDPPPTGDSLTEGELLELSLGAAYRPVRHDWFNLLFKYTLRYETRPVLLTGQLTERSKTEVLSIAPIIELPFRLQFQSQLAMRYRSEEVEGLQPASTVALLWINRLNFHLIKNLDLGIEYRFLWFWQGSKGEPLTLTTIDHGLLLEAAYYIHRYVYVGAGYNFTTFTDDLFRRDILNQGGFFLRVVGKY